MGYENKEIIFGIRPENIHEYFTDSKMPEGGVIPAKITVSELSGAEANLYLTMGDTEIRAIVDPQDYHQPGSEIDIAIDMDKAHFFDKETEVVINRQDEKATVKN